MCVCVCVCVCVCEGQGDTAELTQLKLKICKDRMACQKVCKQGRDDVKVKGNIQNPIPSSFYTRGNFLV